ncbi:MAG: 50S ribosome-binding GTPase [Candidatus Lokiarchaeota archaeon]|nr:50S ribosome-binding GTPase [Candidatus Lokiarchaeota archaeon]
MSGSEQKGESRPKKLLLVGLDNAGKSSIVNIVVKKMTDALTTVPTKSVDRSDIVILGQQVLIHDLGGQQKYRRKYIEKGGLQFFEGTDVLIYVVDLQDRDRYDLALDYFGKALASANQLKISPKLYVFLHKFDGPYLEDYKDVKTRTQLECDALKEKFADIAKEHGLELEDASRTSVKDEWGTFAAFSKVWMSVVPRIESMQRYIDKLVAENEMIGIALLLDQKGTVLAKTLRQLPGEDMEAIVNVAARSVILLLDWQHTIEHNKMDEHQSAIVEVEDHSIMIRRVESGEETFYLLLYAVAGSYQQLQERLGRITFTLETII